MATVDERCSCGAEFHARAVFAEGLPCVLEEWRNTHPCPNRRPRADPARAVRRANEARALGQMLHRQSAARPSLREDSA